MGGVTVPPAELKRGPSPHPPKKVFTCSQSTMSLVAKVDALIDALWRRLFGAGTPRSPRWLTARREYARDEGHLAFFLLLAHGLLLVLKPTVGTEPAPRLRYSE